MANWLCLVISVFGHVIFLCEVFESIGLSPIVCNLIQVRFGCENAGGELLIQQQGVVSIHLPGTVGIVYVTHLKDGHPSLLFHFAQDSFKRVQTDFLRLILKS